ncbi:MAG: Fic family protein [Nanoarchaeota archaeon]|nr:Fic family protein [Nanoarchaeota archaeon]
MVFVENYTSRGKAYYRLSHSIRKGGKIAHLTKQIGRALPPKARLERMKQEFLMELAEGRYKYLNKKEIDEIESRRKSYREEIKSLSPLEKEKKLKEFIIRFTYDSSRLSGADITLRQTYLILKEGIMPKGIKQLRTARELENHEKGILAITAYKGNLSINFIKKLHKIMFAGVDDAIAGKLRSELKRDAKIAGTPYVPPKWHEIPKEMSGFFKWYKSEHRKLHPLELAALIHLKLVSMQPFADGNSRLSRLLMNWILWKKNYPPIDIPIEDLENYYNVLDRYQVKKDEKPCVGYILKWYFKSE